MKRGINKELPNPCSASDFACWSYNVIHNRKQKCWMSQRHAVQISPAMLLVSSSFTFLILKNCWDLSIFVFTRERFGRKRLNARVSLPHGKREKKKIHTLGHGARGGGRGGGAAKRSQRRESLPFLKVLDEVKSANKIWSLATFQWINVSCKSELS